MLDADVEKVAAPAKNEAQEITVDGLRRIA